MTKDEFMSNLIYKQVAIDKKGEAIVEEYINAPKSEKGNIARMKVENDMFASMLNEIGKQFSMIGEKDGD